MFQKMFETIKSSLETKSGDTTTDDEVIAPKKVQRE